MYLGFVRIQIRSELGSVDSVMGAASAGADPRLNFINLLPVGSVHHTTTSALVDTAKISRKNYSARVWRRISIFLLSLFARRVNYLMPSRILMPLFPGKSSIDFGYLQNTLNYLFNRGCSAGCSDRV
jgi:hypothetical protein